MTKIERHESYRGRTTPEVTWRVWNADHTCYMTFKTKREATAYANVSAGREADDDGDVESILRAWRKL